MTNGDGIFRQNFTRIKGLSSIRRLPRLDKIRLGIKKISKKTGKEYPFETDFFVCPAEVRKFYGDEPKELSIMFPLNDPEALFPQCYKWYGSGKGLKCRGDGINALRLNDETHEMEEQKCPCELLEDGKCKQVASLSFMMPSIKIGGVYQIDLSSYHSIVDINSGFDYAMAMLGGRIAMVPFLLRRVPKETHNEGKKQIHYTLQLELDIPLKEAQRIREGENVYINQKKRYAIEPPIESGNPAYDSKKDGAVIVEESDEDEGAKQAGLQEKADEESKQQKENETKLKEEVEAGEHDLKDKEARKDIAKQKEAIKVEIEKAAKKYKYTDWAELIEMGQRRGIFDAGITTSQAARQFLYDHPDKYKVFMALMETDQEVATEDIPF